MRIGWNKKEVSPFQEILDWDQPLFGLSLLPRLEKACPSFADSGFSAVDVSEDDKNIFVKADLPGLKKEEIHVSLDHDVLTIRGERKSESETKDKNYHRVERSYGVFERRIVLGTKVDEAKIKANYKDGVLELTLPKSEQQAVKRIDIGD